MSIISCKSCSFDISMKLQLKNNEKAWKSKSYVAVQQESALKGREKVKTAFFCCKLQ